MSSVLDITVQTINPLSARGHERVLKILEAATELFLKEGYDNTPIDAIVERSGGSKATLYSYFPTKSDLFRAVVDSIVASSVGPMKVDTCENIRATLQEFGEKRLRIIFSRRHQDLLRLVVAERERFPDLAEMYYNRGPQVGRDWLVAYLEALCASKKLEIDDVDEAAEFFIGMMVHEWYKKYLLFNARLPTKREIKRRVERVVDHFLKLYHRD